MLSFEEWTQPFPQNIMFNKHLFLKAQLGLANHLSCQSDNLQAVNTLFKIKLFVSYTLLRGVV